MKFAHYSVLSMAVFLSACGGSSDSGNNTTNNSASNNDSAANLADDNQNNAPIQFSSGTWNTFMNFKSTDATAFGAGFESLIKYQMILDFDNAQITNCEVNVKAPIEDGDFTETPQEVAAELEREFEAEYPLDFQATVTQSSDSHISVLAQDASQQTVLTFDLKKISDALKFSAGSVKVDGEALSTSVNATQDVCADYSQAQSFGPDAPRTTYTIGAPYENTRLAIKISYDGLSLDPGEYDLAAQNDITITVSRIDLPSEAVGEGSNRPINYASASGGLKTGKMIIEQADDAVLKGSFEFENYTYGVISAEFNVTLPQDAP